jgi:hypothetical protein
MIRSLYRGLDGYDVSDEAEAVVFRHRSSPLYGEITPGGVAHLLEYMQLTPEDALFDLGSGVGKVVLQAAISQPLRAAVGFELVRPRHEMAQEALRRAREREVLRTPDVRLLKGDFMRADLSEATVVYTCSTAFPVPMMLRMAQRLSRYPNIRLLVTVQDLDDNPWFLEDDVLRLDMTWRRRARVYVYRPT